MSRRRRERRKKFFRGLGRGLGKLGKTLGSVALPVAQTIARQLPGGGQIAQGLELAQRAGKLTRQVSRGAISAPRGRDARALGAIGSLSQIAGLSDSEASRALGISRWDLARARTLMGEVAGLEGTGPATVWVVKYGDTGSSIAKACVGDGSRWRELKAANPAIATRPDPKGWGLVAYPGERLTLPRSWLEQMGLLTAPAAVLGSTPSGDVEVAPVVSMPPDFTPPASTPPAADVVLPAPPAAYDTTPPDLVLPEDKIVVRTPPDAPVPDAIAADTTPAAEPAPAPAAEPAAEPSKGSSVAVPVALGLAAYAFGMF